MKIKFKKPQSVVSPWLLTVGVLSVWILGIFLGNIINMVTAKYIVDSEGRNFWIIIIYVIVSAAIGIGLAFLITKQAMSVVTDINDNITKLAEGDFTVRMSPITSNPHINSAVKNFNEMVKQLNSVAVLKNDFVSSFTHEFKTPIASIKGYAELLQSSKNLTEEEQEYIRIILEESNRLSMLSENTMILAKLDSDRIITDKREFSLDGQIEDCILLFDSAFKEKNLEVETNLTSARIKNDPYLVKEIWINLISNAVKFSKRGGKIYVSLTQSNGGYIVSVKDEGIGMSEETQKHVFEKFYQADGSHSNKGIGLGLSIVSRIIELVGGKIECSSKLGEGTEMKVTLY